MKEDKLSDLSMQLSVDVLRLTKELKAKHETVISNQIGRSATSVCANIAESKYGHSRADFIAKLEIVLKEANETGKWLEMLLKSDYIDEATYKSINKTCSTIRILLIASIKTAKANQKKWFIKIFFMFFNIKINENFCFFWTGKYLSLKKKYKKLFKMKMY